MPLLVFGFMSSLTPVDIFKETPFSQSDKIFSVIKLETIVLAFIYLIVGFAGYYKFGNELTAFDCGNILLNSEFSKSPILLCNFLIVFFVCVNGVTKFKPAKELITGMLRERSRDSKLWHYLVVIILHISITGITCLVISMRVPLHKFIIIIAGFTGPCVYFVYPFVAFHRTFYFDKRENIRRYIYYGMIYIGVFINISTIGSIFFSYSFDAL
jgi:hypothetical protein